MMTQQEIDVLLDRIGKSSFFGQTSTYTRLLRFLVERTLSDNIPKEQEIAYHVFGENDMSADTSKIRVYVYHLRKKLSQYFEAAGKEEVYVLSIPKGGYKVAIEKKVTDGFLPRFSVKPKYALFSLAALIISAGLGYALARLGSTSSTSQAFQQSVFWQDFFADEKPIQIIIGDLFLFAEFDSSLGEFRNIRIPDLNTTAQYEAYLEQPRNAGRDLREMPYTHILKGSAEWIMHLTRIFHPQKDFHIGVSTDIEAQDLHDYNIVFVGMQKTAGLLNNYFDESEFGYDVSLPNLYLLQQQDTTLKFRPQGDPVGKHTDYGFIAKYPGPNDNTILIFSGLWDSAASESLRNFAISSKMKAMEAEVKARLGYIPQFFEMLIEVDGVDRMGFEGRVLYVNDLEGVR
ncbi:MAG: helix-turn-helix domain-containing protein [Bacteroidota bacterium]